MNLILNDKLLYTNVSREELYDTFDSINEKSYKIVIIEDTDSGSYVQTVCNKFDGVLEIRIYSGAAFRHYRCEFITGADDFDNRERKISTNLFTMTVEQKQIIDVSAIKKIMLYNIENNKIDINADYRWIEMIF